MKGLVASTAMPLRRVVEIERQPYRVDGYTVWAHVAILECGPLHQRMKVESGAPDFVVGELVECFICDPVEVTLLNTSDTPILTVQPKEAYL